VSDPTTVLLSCWIALDATDASSAVLLIHPSESDGQRLLDEDLEVDGADVELLSRGDARPARLRATGSGPVQVRYRATAELTHEALAPTTDTTLPPLGELDLDLLHWTLPSRYCPSDVLGPQAIDMFGDLPRDGSLLDAVRDWVEDNIDYVPGSSDPHTAADETFLGRQGVCRDLAHLTITFLRALDVPARMVAAYALDLEPQDLHALVEAHDGTRWRLLDATGLAPVETTVRIATGHDATEIAWMTGGPGMNLEALSVDVRRA
jgi:transglutaminase-like putative cysteine protease